LSYLGGLGSPVASVVPRPLLAERIGRHWVLVQSPMPGRPMQAAMRSEIPDAAEAERQFSAVSVWLAELYRSTVTSNRAVAAAAAHAADGIIASVLETAPEAGIDAYARSLRQDLSA